MQEQQLQKEIMKTTKPVTLKMFSTTSVYSFIKKKGHGMRLNLTGKPIANSQLPNSMQCTPTYCNLESGSHIMSLRLRNA